MSQIALAMPLMSLSRKMSTMTENIIMRTLMKRKATKVTQRASQMVNASIGFS